MEQLVLLLPVIPIISALMTQLLSSSMGRRVSRISVIGGTLTFALASTLLLMVLMNYPVAHYSFGETWGSLYFDPLAVLMSTVIAAISLLVRIYSVRYMAEEYGYGRFFVLLDVMSASLILMVAAADMITLLVAWHLIGVFLYFLLGHETRSFSAFRYGFWTFITYRFGDLPLVLAAAVLFHTFDSWSLPEIFAAIEANPDVTTFFGFRVVEVVGSLIAVSAFARSAQFLVHTWLPYTMEGPTPVSALMHAGIVNAGGILLNRFAPLYLQTDSVLHWVFLVGLITAVIGSILMLAQSDIKKALGYSTMGQMGFMIMECGVGAFSLAIFHLIAHGLFKGTLFLSAGSVINQARKHDGIPKDELYQFIVERRPTRKNFPWLAMAILTIIVPAFVLFSSHFAVTPDLFEKQGAIILLFFGWVTGAQVLFSTYQMDTHHPWRLLLLVMMTFVIVVLGYTYISHAFDVFLFPDAVFAHQLYVAAGTDTLLFNLAAISIALLIVATWLRTYWKESHFVHDVVTRHWARNFYAIVSREFHVSDVYKHLSQWTINLSARTNIWLRWG